MRSDVRSRMVRDGAMRAKFVRERVKLCETYGFDGKKLEKISYETAVVDHVR